MHENHKVLIWSVKENAKINTLYVCVWAQNNIGPSSYHLRPSTFALWANVVVG